MAAATVENRVPWKYVDPNWALTTRPIFFPTTTSSRPLNLCTKENAHRAYSIVANKDITRTEKAEVIRKWIMESWRFPSSPLKKNRLSVQEPAQFYVATSIHDLHRGGRILESVDLQVMEEVAIKFSFDGFRMVIKIDTVEEGSGWETMKCLASIITFCGVLSPAQIEEFKTRLRLDRDLGGPLIDTVPSYPGIPYHVKISGSCGQCLRPLVRQWVEIIEVKDTGRRKEICCSANAQKFHNGLFHRPLSPLPHLSWWSE